MEQRMNFRFITSLLLLLAVFFAHEAQAQFGGKKDLVKIKSYISFDKVHSGSEVKLAVEVAIDSTWHINSNAPKDEFLIPSELTITGDKPINVNKVVFPHAEELEFSFSDVPVSVYEGTVYIGALIQIPDDIPEGELKLTIRLDYQACDNATCLAPNYTTDTLVVTVAPKTELINEVNQQVFKNIDMSYTPPVEEVKKKDDDGLTGLLESSGLLFSLLIVFLGGLALNLTPCVYPLIPITVGYFGGQSEGNTKKLALLGALFVLGMALMYSVVGVVTALTGAVFGALLQSPYVIVAIVLVLVALSLSMFGVYEFQLPSGLVNMAGGARGGLYGAFFMGLTMGIVAAPCIGPFVLGLVTVVAAKSDPLYGFLMFFVLALGLGLPYFVLAIFSGKIKALPRAGMWMESVKHIFGFILLGMAVYFLLPVLPSPFKEYSLPVFMVVAALYLLFFEKVSEKLKGFKVFKNSFAVLILAVGIWFMIPTDEQSIAWSKFDEKEFSQALESGDKVIIDFYADWCIPCKELDKLTFSDPAVIEKSEEFKTFKADLTKSMSPEVEKLREEFQIVGVPTVLIIDSSGKEVERITGFVNAEEFLAMLKSVN